MSTLMQASTQWATRPADERFTSLDDLLDHCRRMKESSYAKVVSVRKLEAVPVDDTNHKGLAIRGDLPGNQEIALPTHWSFGQLAQRAEAPAGYLRKLPNFLTADLMNWGMRNRPVEEVGLLVHDGENQKQVVELAAATGPNYGRIWNEQIVSALVDRFGNGINGRFRVPGEFGKPVPITKENTTLYAGDRDMFVFLADEENRIELPNRRTLANGTSLTGSLARGFFMWNSEVGSSTYGIATFLYDYVCCNRMVWGAEDVKEVRIRHTSGAPDRFIEEVKPALVQMANSSTHNVVEAIENARKAKIDDVDEFLAKRFTSGQVNGIKIAFASDEGRPMENVWDAVTGVTAYARGIEYQDQRIDLERSAGKLLKLAA